MVLDALVEEEERAERITFSPPHTHTSPGSHLRRHVWASREEKAHAEGCTSDGGTHLKGTEPDAGKTSEVTVGTRTSRLTRMMES